MAKVSKFKTTIGLEIHVQLKTKSKMFCSCDNNAENAEPNTLICPVCLGMPGTLPVANKEAVEATIKTGLAFGSKIPKQSKFDRKHYFYPDLPKGFQISQYDQPLCQGGEIEVDGLKVRLNRIHLEEDAGKLIHPADKNYSLVDLNRAGTPLMEIVTEPDITSPSQAKRFLQQLQLTLRYLKVSDADMEKGHLRCDANISVQKDGRSSPIIEIKNLNSFRFVEQALLFEENRLREDNASWPKDRMKITRGFDSQRMVTYEQRKKEEAADYRYFPEPDIPPIEISADYLQKIKSSLVDLPDERKKRYLSAGIRADIAEKIVANPDIAEYLETADELKKELAVFISEEVPGIISKLKIPFSEYQRRVPITAIADLLSFVGSGVVSKTAAKAVFYQMVETGKRAKDIIEKSNIVQISDSTELKPVIIQTLKENPDLVKKYRQGKVQVIGFFVGQIMRKTSGRANPQVLNKLIKEILDADNY